MSLNPSQQRRSDESARARIGARAYETVRVRPPRGAAARESPRSGHGLVAGGPIAVSGPEEEGGLEAGPLVRNRKSHFSFCALMNSR
jgi:hypothetical protein